MRFRFISSILVAVVIIPCLLGAHDFSPLGNILASESKSPCETNQRDPGKPECPNCISFEDSTDPFLYEHTETCQVKVVSPLIPVDPEALFDQGFVRSIFRPPSSIL